MYKVEGIKKQIVQCEISPKQVAYIIQGEYCNILGCTFGSIVYGELRRENNTVVKRDKSVFKKLSEEETKYVEALEVAMGYFEMKAREGEK